MRRLISNVRIMCKLFIIIWIVYLLFAAQVEAGTSLELKISLPKDSIVQREPIFAKLELKNVGDEGVTLSDLWYLGVVIYVVSDNEQQKPYHLGGGLGREADIWGGSITLNPGQTLTYCEMLLYNAYRTRGYIFDRSDRYRIWATYYSVRSNEVTLDVRKATGIDAEAWELITNYEYPSIVSQSKRYSPSDFGLPEDTSSKTIAEFVRDGAIADFFYYGGTTLQEIADAFSKLVESYPQSVYTRYALFSLGKVYAGEKYASDKIKKDPSKAIPYLEKLINEFPPNEQTEDALWMLIEAHGQARNLAKMRSYLLEFKRRFPKSSRIVSVNQTLEGLDKLREK